MKFIRDNLFLLIVIAAVVILGGSLLAVDFSISDDVDAQIQERANLSTTLRGYTSPGGYVNPEMVAAERERVNMILNDANDIVKEQARRNRQSYYIPLTLPVEAEGRVIMQLPAFPYDSNMYRNYPLVSRFAEADRDYVDAQLHLLHPTQPPTVAEIQGWMAILKTSPVPLAPATAPAGGRTGAETDPNIIRATDYAEYEKATAGEIYVDRATLHSEMDLPDGTDPSDDAALWKRQIKLWLFTDLIAAIKATNDEVLTPAHVPNLSDRNVCNAAVKRLVNITVKDTYASSSAAPAGGAFMPSPGNMGGRGESGRNEGVRSGVPPGREPPGREPQAESRQA